METILMLNDMKIPKLKIVHIGYRPTEIRDNDGRIVYQGGFGWYFDGSEIQNSVGMSLGEDGTVLYGGYTIEELCLIHDFYHRGLKEGSIAFKIRKLFKGLLE